MYDLPPDLDVTTVSTGNVVIGSLVTPGSSALGAQTMGRSPMC